MKMIKSTQLKPFLLGLSVSIIILASFFGGAIADRMFQMKPLDFLFPPRVLNQAESEFKQRGEVSPLGQIVRDSSSAVADVSEEASKSVVTVSIKKQQRIVNPQDLFGSGFFGFNAPQGEAFEEVKRDIGTGFVVDKGIVVTNKHVVSDAQAEYQVIDKDDKEYSVTKIYRDPTTDLALLQIKDFELPALPLGNSDSLRVGESVIAIGTALGEFRHTVTTGVISGLGRGIAAGDGFSQLESLEGVIQTDAAINPGNSGGPLINSQGEVIGVNVATANADNISFAIPINVISASLENFNQTGQFDRPMLGVRYQMISEKAALLNEVPAGAYIHEIVEGSSAQEAGLKPADIISKFDGDDLKDKDLATLINKKKIGDKVEIEYWRNGESKTIKVELKGV